MDTPAVRRAVAADRERVVATVVAAFEQDPAFTYFFADRYSEEAPTFVGHLFDRRIRFDTVWVAADGDAVAMWNPPEATSSEPIQGVSAATSARMHTYDAAVHAAMPDSPYWYLGVLATHPDHAGHRLGRAVMAEGLALAARDGLPAYLETWTEVNVRIYSASGWEVADTVAVDGHAVWVMVHQADQVK